MLTPLLATFPAFAAYFAASVGLLILFLFVYTAITPHREIALTRAGNPAAAAALIGATIGYVLPLASVITHAVSLLDLVLWGAIALIVQISTFFAVKLLLLPGLAYRIESGSVAHGVAVGGLSAAVGVLNAACLVWDPAAAAIVK